MSNELLTAEQFRNGLDAIVADLDAALVMCSQLEFAGLNGAVSLSVALKTARAYAHAAMPKEPEDEMQHMMRTRHSDR